MVRFAILIGLLFLSFRVVADTGTQCEPNETSAPTIHYDAEADIDLSLKDVFEPQILAYLNSGTAIAGLASAIEMSADYPKFFAETVEADFTADNQTDILVTFSASWGAGFEAYLLLFSCHDNAYVQQASTAFSGWDAGVPVDVLYALDLNNNQFRDIVLSIISVEGQKYHETLKIFEWDGTALAERFSLGPEYGGYGFQLVYADASPASPYLGIGDAYAYEEETALAFIEYNYIRPTRQLYQWNGAAYTYLCRHFTDSPQLYPTILHSAESYRACGNYETAASYYQQLIGGDISFEDDRWYAQPFILYPEDISEAEQSDYALELERAYYPSFAAYRLLQIAIYDGNSSEIEFQLAWLNTRYSAGEAGYVYAAMAYALWENYQLNSDLARACQAASLAFEAAYTTGDDPNIQYYDEDYDGETFHYGFYFTSGRPYAADPNNLFAVPDSIDGMVSTPICL